MATPASPMSSVDFSTSDNFDELDVTVDPGCSEGDGDSLAELAAGVVWTNFPLQFDDLRIVLTGDFEGYETFYTYDELYELFGPRPAGFDERSIGDDFARSGLIAAIVVGVGLLVFVAVAVVAIILIVRARKRRGPTLPPPWPPRSGASQWPPGPPPQQVPYQPQPHPYQPAPPQAGPGTWAQPGPVPPQPEPPSPAEPSGWGAPPPPGSDCGFAALVAPLKAGRFRPSQGRYRDRTAQVAPSADASGSAWASPGPTASPLTCSIGSSSGLGPSPSWLRISASRAWASLLT